MKYKHKIHVFKGRMMAFKDRSSLSGQLAGSLESRRKGTLVSSYQFARPTYGLALLRSQNVD
jgi:hypothetical protein